MAHGQRRDRPFDGDLADFSAAGRARFIEAFCVDRPSGRQRLVAVRPTPSTQDDTKKSLAGKLISIAWMAIGTVTAIYLIFFRGSSGQLAHAKAALDRL
jgi:hypothetical protein